MRFVASGLALAASLALTSFLTGCALENTAAPSPVTGAAITGTVFGGSQPIVGARVYLLTPGISGSAGPGIAPTSANASLSLLNSSVAGAGHDSIGYYVTTNSSGVFSVSGNYSCTTAYAQSTGTSVTITSPNVVYLYAVGGYSTVAQQPGNPASALLAVAGSCSSGIRKPTVALNEVTTIGAAYALAGYASDALHISSSNSTYAQRGLSNATTALNNLVVRATGVPAASTATITTPAANIYTLANILAMCVNSTGDTSAGSACGTLFQYASSNGASGTQPTETATAAINLAHNPWPTAAGMTALYNLVPATGAPFAGGLTAQPNDFTLAVNITGSLSTPQSVAIDVYGDALVTNNVATGATICIYLPSGALATSSCPSANGSTYPYAIAADPYGYLWSANNDNSLTVMSEPSIVQKSPTGGYTGGGLNFPQAVAIDLNGNAWVANYGNGSNSSVSEFAQVYAANAGSAISPSTGYAAGSVQQPYAIAIDASGTIWVPSSGNNKVVRLSGSDGSILSPPAVGAYTGGGLSAPDAIAFDNANNVWLANLNSNNLSKFASVTNGGGALSPSTPTVGSFAGGGLNIPYAIALDSAGVAWVANFGGNSISAFSNNGAPITPFTGYSSGNLNKPSSIAIDESGNVWVPNSGGNSLTEFIGLASPVVTPLVTNVRAPLSAPASHP